MGEIEFRVWNIKKKKFLDTGICFTKTGMFETTSGWKSPKEEDLKLSQFTRLKDKDGKKIFIGDILIWDNECIIEIKSKDELGFYYRVLAQKDKNICMFDIRFYRSEESSKVIGNIYKNKEMLLKKYWNNKKIKDFAFEVRGEQ